MNQRHSSTWKQKLRLDENLLEVTGLEGGGNGSKQKPLSCRDPTPSCYWWYLLHWIVIAYLFVFNWTLLAWNDEVLFFSVAFVTCVGSCLVTKWARGWAIRMQKSKMAPSPTFLSSQGWGSVSWRPGLARRWPQCSAPIDTCWNWIWQEMHWRTWVWSCCVKAWGTQSVGCESCGEYFVGPTQKANLLILNDGLNMQSLFEYPCS